MKKIYFMRHGEVHNPKQILYGRMPGFRLSAHAQNKIIETAKKLSNKNIRKIFCSPLLRAVQTADIVSKVIYVPIKKSRLLIEVKNDFQGVTLTHFQNHIEPYQYDKIDISSKVESVVSIHTRMLRFIRNCYKQDPDKAILAVTHGDPIVILRSRVTGAKFSWKYKVKNYIQTAEYLSFEYDGKSLYLREDTI